MKRCSTQTSGERKKRPRRCVSIGRKKIAKDQDWKKKEFAMRWDLCEEEGITIKRVGEKKKK